ncbi:hypothetical protein [Burkholderia cepacia]|uniref:hypothetical protein n=1 Tax=Burkholderia cepacia TaxID=292 RepID=UPI000AE72FA7|nr:hypothetical protein [Burkholderia cepacia]
MGIRAYPKRQPVDNDADGRPIASDSTPTAEDGGTLLAFWTIHPRAPVYVDLQPFYDGQTSSRRLGRSDDWNGPFTGRPKLIEQLAPSIHTILQYAPARTVAQHLQALRHWWRLFDAIEADASSDAVIQTVVVIEHVTEVHRQCAWDCHMRPATFYTFLQVLNLARQSRHLHRLEWHAPRTRPPLRHLPPTWQIRRIRFELKHVWFRTLARWERTDQLLSGQPPVSEEEASQLKNYQLFQQRMKEIHHPCPGLKALRPRVPISTLHAQGYHFELMANGFYPSSSDIRVAFHLCLADTGWNPSVLLDLDVDDRWLEPHPKDASRYLMYGYKSRGGTEQISEGLFKSRGSPGMIIQALVARTAPLRSQLREELLQARSTYARLNASDPQSTACNSAKARVVKLEQGVRSPWLYVSKIGRHIFWLNSITYCRTSIGEHTGFLASLISTINATQPANAQLAHLTASDFRDAFAAFAYDVSGGMVLHVMNVLGHQHLNTTQRYLDNTLLHQQSNWLYLTFANALWGELGTQGHVDPTIIAKWSRDGSVTVSDRRRLHQYRTLMRSRIGVGCQRPTHPPPHLAPDFVPDGHALCPIQRCTLCPEHAVIFPDSLPGLAKRLAELQHIRSHMATPAFMASSFPQELDNTRLALTYFDTRSVQLAVSQWEQKIATGEHRVIDHDGTPA